MRMSAAISTGYVNRPTLASMPLSILSLYETAPFEQAHAGDGGEDPGQLGHLGHVGLAEEDGLVGVEAQGEVIQGDVDVCLDEVGCPSPCRRRGSWIWFNRP